MCHLLFCWAGYASGGELNLQALAAGVERKQQSHARELDLPPDENATAVTVLPCSRCPKLSKLIVGDCVCPPVPKTSFTKIDGEGDKAMPGAGGAVIRRSLVYFKFHKTGSTTASYNIYQALHNAAGRTNTTLQVPGRKVYKLRGALDNWCKDNACSKPGGDVKVTNACFLDLHLDLLLLKGATEPHGPLQECFGSLDNVLLTTTVREPYSKLFSWMFYTCMRQNGKFKTRTHMPDPQTLVDDWDEMDRVCALDNEYSSAIPWINDTMSVTDIVQAFTRVGLLTGVVERLDEYFVLLALETGIDVVNFARHLPLNNKSAPKGRSEADYNQWTKRMLSDESVRRKIENHINPVEYRIYEAAKQRQDEWRASYDAYIFEQAMERYSETRQRFLDSYSIPHEGNMAILNCEDASLMKRLPRIHVGDSKIGTPGGIAINYCARM